MDDGVHQGRAEELLTRLPDESVRLLLTDQPYGISRENNFDTMGRRGIDFGEWDQAFDPEPYLRAAWPKLMRGASLVVFNDCWKMGALRAVMERVGYQVKRKVYWHKTNPPPFNATRLFVSAVEEGLWAVKPGKWVFRRRWGQLEDGVFRYPSPPGRERPGRWRHPCKKPDLLFCDLIEHLTLPGELVVDPFAGGGTTLYAAKVTGRRCISFELDPQWVRESELHLAEAPCHDASPDSRALRAALEVLET